MTLTELNIILRKKENRYKVYIKVKELYKENILNDDFIGLCTIIHEAINIVYRYDINTSYIYEYYLPEILDLKPKNADFDAYWWNVKDTEIRLKKLNEIINIVK